MEATNDVAESIGGEPYTIPIAKAVPKPNPPAHRPEEINYADKEDVAEKAVSWLKRYYDKFTSQGARSEFLANMDTADQLFRASATRTSLNATESDNLKVTGSHVKSASYYVDLRTISAYEQSVILGDRNELPIVYDPIPRSDEYEEDEGQRIAKAQNATLYWAFTEDDMWGKIADLDFFTNKNANQFIEMCWDYKTEEKLCRVPAEKYSPESTAWETRGEGDEAVPIPIRFKEVLKKNVVVKDAPTMVMHDNKDAWADAMISDVQNQSCIIFRTQKQLGDLYNMQANGIIANVDKIKSPQAYDGENTQDIEDLKANRQTNANEAPDSSEPNTMIDIYHGYIRIPVADGKWDERLNLPRWHKFTFAGDINAQPVALLIQPNRWGESIPVECAHSHKDDKGLYHNGYIQRVKSVLAQEMTTIDQATDNWTKRICAPLLAQEGSLLTRKKEFTDGRNPIWYYKGGTNKPEPFRVEDSTQLAIPMLRMLESKRFEVMGINKTFRGEELGSRTSAGEALTVFDMAKKPAYEDVIYKGNQFLPFIATWVMRFTRAYMNPSMRVQISYSGNMYDVAPGALYGELKTKQTFVAQFENGLMAKKEMNDFYTQRLPIYIQGGVVGKKGLAILAKQEMKNLYIKDVEDIVEEQSNHDAERNAQMENEAIVFHGVYDMPIAGEDDETHLKVHEPFYVQMGLLPEAERPSKDNLGIMKMHMEVHKQHKEQQGAQMGATAGMLQQQGQESAPRTEGEAVGDELAADAGAQENAVPEMNL